MSNYLDNWVGMIDNIKPPSMSDPGNNLTRDKHVWDMR